jgi:type II secretory pathway pseudopilin PulG
VIAVIAILAGAAIPVASRAWNSAARRATRERLDVLARATLEYFRDVGRAPRDLGDLLVRPDELSADGDDRRPPGEAGWIGPYLSLDVPAQRDEHDARPIPCDAWSRAITIERDPRGDRCTLRSLGLDGVASEDDLVLGVDFTPLRRERTLRELDEANRALAGWRAAHAGEVLERDWRRALERLVADGYLPRGGEHESDGWDRPYVVDPRLARPEWRVASPELLERAATAR